MIAIHESTLNPLLDKIADVLKAHEMPDTAKYLITGVLAEFHGMIESAADQTEQYKAWISKAEEKYANHTNDIEIDSENAAVPLSIADDGVWVQAWLWVGNPEANPCPHCDRDGCELCHDTGDAGQIDDDNPHPVATE